MYSGTTFRTKSGRMIGVHQKIDRIARKQVSLFTSGNNIPSIKLILHFEGLNGPDGIKRKSPGIDEPWHFVDPKKDSEQPIFVLISGHMYNAKKAIKGGDKVQAAFELAWMSHAITDMLTPAHQYPFEEKLEEIRGEGLETRTTRKSKFIMPGDTFSKKINNNWKYWGAKGVMTSHLEFEFGVALAFSTYKAKKQIINSDDIKKYEKRGYINILYDDMQYIDSLDLYNYFLAKGWNRKLAIAVQKQLLPVIIKAVTFCWFECSK